MISKYIECENNEEITDKYTIKSDTIPFQFYNSTDVFKKMYKKISKKTQETQETV